MNPESLPTNATLPPPLDYQLRSDTDGIDFGEAGNDTEYSSVTGYERDRRYGPISQPTYQSGERVPSGQQFEPEAALAADGVSFRPAHTFSDSAHASIAASPITGTSTFPHYSFQHHHPQPLYPNYAAAQPPAHTFLSHYHQPRVSVVGEDTTSVALQPSLPPRTSLGGLVHAEDRVGYTLATPFMPRANLSLPHGYRIYPDTPQTLTGVPPTQPFPFGGPGHHQQALPSMAPPLSPMITGSRHGTTDPECVSNFTFPELQTQNTLSFEEPHTGVAGELNVDLIPNVGKGFFRPSIPETKWTCYRRNYFNVTGAFTLQDAYNGGQATIPSGSRFYYTDENGIKRPIMAFGMKISASVDGDGRKTIELVQHTPKRDAGPKHNIVITKVAPTVGQVARPQDVHGFQSIMPTHYGQQQGLWHLPCQAIQPDEMADVAECNRPQAYVPTAMAGNFATPTGVQQAAGWGQQHTFDRVQFKQATANNGKRRASQQYFHLHVEVWADIRANPNVDAEWVRLAMRTSDKIVVRGRSPSHYKDDSNGGTRSGRGGSISYVPSPRAQLMPSSSRHHHHLELAGARSGYYAGYISDNAYGMAGPEQSPSSTQSAESGATDDPLNMHANFEPGASRIEELGDDPQPAANYQWNGAAMFEPRKREGSGREITDPRGYAVHHEYPQAQLHPGFVPSSSRFQEYDTSRNRFPNIGGLPRYDT